MSSDAKRIVPPTAPENRKTSSTARCAREGSLPSSAHCSGYSANKASARPNWLRVVSVPPTMTASTIIVSSSVLSLSPASSAAMRSVMRSSAGTERRFSISPLVYVSSSCCAARKTDMFSDKFSLKISKISEARRLKSLQSSFGAPNNSQIMGMGYGSQMSLTTSALPEAVNGLRSEFTVSRMKGRSRSALRGENAGATRRRKRTWTSPSAFKIETWRRPRKASSVIPCSCAIMPVAECHLLSRRIPMTDS